MGTSSDDTESRTGDTEPAIRKYVVTNIGEFAEAIPKIVRYTGMNLRWRGHAMRKWSLVPRLYRHGLADYEKQMAVQFRSKPPVRYAKCPNKDDNLSWLFLMQHYRLPTRLLDWSESPLVALYFALENAEYDASDAAIWAMSFSGFWSHQMGGERDPYDLVYELATDAFGKDDGLALTDILPTIAEHHDLRYLMQQAAYTIHGCDTPIEELPNAHFYLARIDIPAENKSDLRRTLKWLGISRASLFPDLENLSSELLVKHPRPRLKN